MWPFLRHVVARLRAVFRRDAVAGEIHDELQFHQQMRIEEYQRRGHSASEARRLATARVGNLAIHQDRGYDVRGGGVLETVAQDVRYALRLWMRQPGVALAAISALALGIGLSTALFSVIDAAVIRPLPFSDPEQLAIAWVHERSADGSEEATGPSLNDARFWRSAGQSIIAAGVMRTYPEPVVVQIGGGAERATVSEMGDGCLDVYQRRALMGRGFAPEDLEPGAPRAVVLGYDYWRLRFGGSAAALGQTIRFAEGGAATIVGVMPPDFYRRTDLWRPHPIPDAARAERRGLGTDTYVRVRPGVSMAAAAEELTRITRQRQGDSDHVGDLKITLQPLLADARSGHGATIPLLVWAVTFVLLIACINVAGLLLARGAARRSEFAIRASIGAGRSRLVRQLLTESTLLAMTGGLVGALLAWLSLDALVSMVPLDLPPSASATLSPAVLAFATVLSIATSVAVGLLPAAKLSRGDATLGSLGGKQQHGSALSRRTGQWLIGAEVAVSIILLVAAGLFVRSLNRLMTTDIGFDPRAVLMMTVAPVSRSHGDLEQYYPTLIERIRARPDVAAVGAVDSPPLGEWGVFGFARSQYRDQVDVRVSQALPGYVEAMGLAIREGRMPAASEFSTGRFVALNEAAARQLFPQGNAIGQSIRLGLVIPREVAAVVADVRQDGPSRPIEPMVISLASRPVSSPLTVVVRPVPGSRVSTADLRDVAQSIGPVIFIDHVGPATDLLAGATATPRHRMLLFALLGTLGLVLTLVGIFGTTAYAVTMRTREIGVRMAFGARPSQVVVTIVRDALWPALVGKAVGVVGAVVGTKAIATFLFQITPTDPLTFAGAVGLLGVTAFLAAWWPARRAARVDPVEALRSE